MFQNPGAAPGGFGFSAPTTTPATNPLQKTPTFFSPTPSTPAPTTTPMFAQTGQQQVPAFGQQQQQQVPAFGQQQVPAFGQQQQVPAFGQQQQQQQVPAFGPQQSPAFGQQPSPAYQPPAFGQQQTTMFSPSQTPAFGAQQARPAFAPAGQQMQQQQPTIGGVGLFGPVAPLPQASSGSVLNAATFVPQTAQQQQANQQQPQITWTMKFSELPPQYKQAVIDLRYMLH